VWADDPVCPVDSETKAATAAVVASLRSVGATVSEVARPAFDAAEMFRIYLTLLGATMCWNAEGETRAMHESVAKGFGPAPPAEGCGNNVVISYIKTSFLSHFYATNRRFFKTGSGQS
jgi:Asp-tRNA(Asn)/Glu-tRNA(Gln) amidotransferase A subunit family amidase